MTQGIRFNLNFEEHSDEEVEAYERSIAQQKCTEAFHNCGIGRQFYDSALQDYKRTYPQQEQMLARAREFFGNVIHGKRSNMIIVGEAGEGKTELAAGLLKQFAFTKRVIKVNGHEIECYYSVKYVTSFELCSLFRKARSLSSNAKDYGEYSFYRDFTRTYDVMVIDEVGKGGEPNEWDLLFDILDKRMQENKWTILISNFSYEELNKRVSKYAMSRLNAGGNLIIVEAKGMPDFRQNPALLDRQA